MKRGPYKRYLNEIDPIGSMPKKTQRNHYKRINLQNSDRIDANTDDPYKFMYIVYGI